MLEFFSCALIALYLMFVIFHFIFTTFYIYGVFQLSVTKHNEIGNKSLLLHQQRHLWVHSAIIFSVRIVHLARSRICRINFIWGNKKLRCSVSWCTVRQKGCVFSILLRAKTNLNRLLLAICFALALSSPHDKENFCKDGLRKR